MSINYYNVDIILKKNSLILQLKILKKMLKKNINHYWRKKIKKLYKALINRNLEYKDNYFIWMYDFFVT